MYGVLYDQGRVTTWYGAFLPISVTSLFRYRNDRNLCKLSYSSGHFDALRDGAPESIPEKDLVPGDVVVVRSGITYCDMVLVSSHGVLVDRSHERVNPSCEIGCLAIAPRNTTR
jgi:hypothetical protein